MSILNLLIQWSYPLADILIAIFCFIYIKHKVGFLLGIGFILLSVGALIWQVANLISIAFGVDVTLAYQIAKFSGPVTFFVAVIIFIVAIIKIGALINSGTGKSNLPES